MRILSKILLVLLTALLLTSTATASTRVTVSPGEELTLNLQLKNVGEVLLKDVSALVDTQPAWVQVKDASSTVSVPCFAAEATKVLLPLHLTISEHVTTGTEGELRLAVRDESGASWPVELLLSVVPSCYALHPNFPNPFNPQTTLSFDLPASGPVSLKVYNIRGQCIKTLVDGTMDAGTHHVVWAGVDESGQAMGSGIYFYRLQAEGFTQTRKMLLVK